VNLAALMPLAQEMGSFWMPPQSSTVAPAVDALFYLIFWISAVFFVGIVGAMLVFLLRYRRREGHEAQKTSSHNTALELTWSIIPLILVVVIFYMGFKVYLDMQNPPANAYEVQVNAQKWSWNFTYPNGYVDANLHVPVDRPIKLVMQSEDVIHSFFVPAFRVKMDVVPGRYTRTWFHATEIGEYVIFCTEYCGTGHSDMLASVVVHPPGEFETWLEAASNFLDTLPPDEAGEKLFVVRGCPQCHTVDGSGSTGPTFQGLWGSTHTLADGASVEVEENYVRESILDPQAKVAAGFDPVMPTYQGRLKDEEITAIIAYMKTLAQ
jgi:cytochrome c oxidase subunit II